jgi:hypothetical protein
MTCTPSWGWWIVAARLSSQLGFSPLSTESPDHAERMTTRVWTTSLPDQGAAATRTADHGLLLTRLLGPAGPELTCERCFDQLDRYVELELAEAHADREVPGMRAHLEGCPACAEEHQSLLTYVAERIG